MSYDREKKPGTVYVDEAFLPYGRMLMCHMLSEDVDALHAMADRIGVRRKWFQEKPGKIPHYDVCKTKRAEALRMGAVEADRRKVAELIVFWRSGGKRKSRRRDGTVRYTYKVTAWGGGMERRTAYRKTWEGVEKAKDKLMRRKPFGLAHTRWIIQRRRDATLERGPGPWREVVRGERNL